MYCVEGKRDDLRRLNRDQTVVAIAAVTPLTRWISGVGGGDLHGGRPVTSWDCATGGGSGPGVRGGEMMAHACCCLDSSVPSLTQLLAELANHTCVEETPCTALHGSARLHRDLCGLCTP